MAFYRREGLLPDVHEATVREATFHTMNTYLVESSTNYGLMVHVVNADTPDRAKDLTLEHRRENPTEYGAWLDCRVTQINTITPGVVLFAPT